MKIHCLYDELIDERTLKPHPKNRNMHSTPQIKRLAEILEYQGWRYPIKVSKRSGFITSGHGRLQAAIYNKWKEVPVNFQEYDSDEQEYADVQADNAIASWAELDLSGINADIGDLGPDFDLNMLGIKDFVLEPADKYGDKDADEVPETRQTSIKVGDLFQLGTHRLLCGDSTMASEVDRLMNGEKASMLCWDPPWNVGFEYNSHDDTIDNEKYERFLGDCITNFNANALQSNVAVVWQSEKNWTRFHEWFPKEARIVAVLKNFVQLSKGHLQRAWDPALMWCGKEYEFQKVDGHHQRDYLLANTAATTQTEDRVISGNHPCPRTVDTYEYFVTGWSRREVIVTDLSAGSGTAFIACEKTSRRCFGMEIDPVYCQVIIDRWENFTGQKAVKL